MQSNKKEKLQLAPEENLIQLLNQLLANTVHLKLQAKDAHWNIKGTNFIALHNLFDQVATTADEHADLLAERAVQLGGYALGGLRDITKRTELVDNADRMHDIEFHLKSLSNSLKISAACTNHAIEIATSSNDPATADLFTQITQVLDKQRWLVESNIS